MSSRIALATALVNLQIADAEIAFTGTNNAIKEQLEEMGVTPEQMAIVSDECTSTQYAALDEVSEILIEYWNSSSLSDDELNSVVAFLSSPIGHTFLKMSAESAGKIMTVVGGYIVDMQERLMKKLDTQ